MIRRKRCFAALVTGLIGIAVTATAAEVRLNNRDAGTGQGLDDPTPAAAVGGNPGRTRGEQARIVFEYAASIWGAVLKSRVPIDIDASFKRLACTARSGLLGSAGTTDAVFFRPGKAPLGARSNTLYHLALANALAGADIRPGQADVNANFNGAIGTPGCIEGKQWYFGLDGNASATQVDFLQIALHELSHGLGFLGFNYLNTGKLSTDDADGTVLADMYSSYVYDNALGKGWYGMTDAERKQAALDDGRLVFTGPHVKAHAALAILPRRVLQVAAPAAIAGEYGYSWASAPADFAGATVRAASGANAEACSALDNAADVAGHVALIDFGTSCPLETKLRFAQAAGATGVIVVNDRAGARVPQARDGAASMPLPVIVISKRDGDTFKANLAGLHIKMRTLRTGMDASGNVLLYAPRTLEPGSSFVHFDTRVWPAPLMEPADTRRGKALFDLDLTPSVFLDEGWRLNTGGQLLGLCDTGVPTWLPGGVVAGANIAAQAKMLARSSASASDYATAIRAHAAMLARYGLLSEAQASSLNACLSDEEAARQYGGWRQGGAGVPAFIELDNGASLLRQSGAAGSERLYLLTVPSGVRTLNIRSFGGTGDVSLYVKVGNEPGPASYSYRSVHVGNNESVVTARPAAGAYFIKLTGVRDYAGVSLQASYGM